MKRNPRGLSRRTFLKSLGALGASLYLAPGRVPAAPQPLLKKAIPATGEQLPVIGMGSWITFNVGDNESLRTERRQVLQTFFDHGGAVIY